MSTKNETTETNLETEYSADTDQGKPNRVGKLLNRFSESAKNSPKKMLLYMCLILGASYMITTVVQIYSKQKRIESITGVGSDIQEDLTSPVNADYSFANYQTMTKLKDTLEYLMAKGSNLTAADTATFLRVIDQFHKVDPSLFEKVMAIKKTQAQYPLDTAISNMTPEEIEAKADEYYNELMKQQ